MPAAPAALRIAPLSRGREGYTIGMVAASRNAANPVGGSAKRTQLRRRPQRASYGGPAAGRAASAAANSRPPRWTGRSAVPRAPQPIHSDCGGPAVARATERRGQLTPAAVNRP